MILYKNKHTKAVNYEEEDDDNVPNSTPDVIQNSRLL